MSYKTVAEIMQGAEESEIPAQVYDTYSEQECLSFDDCASCDAKACSDIRRARVDDDDWA